MIRSKWRRGKEAKAEEEEKERKKKIGGGEEMRVLLIETLMDLHVDGTVEEVRLHSTDMMRLEVQTLAVEKRKTK